MGSSGTFGITQVSRAADFSGSQIRSTRKFQIKGQTPQEREARERARKETNTHEEFIHDLRKGKLTQTVHASPENRPAGSTDDVVQTINGTGPDSNWTLVKGMSNGVPVTARRTDRPRVVPPLQQVPQGATIGQAARIHAENLGNRYRYLVGIDEPPPVQGTKEPRTGREHFLHGLLGSASPWKGAGRDLRISHDAYGHVIATQDLGNGYIRRYSRRKPEESELPPEKWSADPGTPSPNPPPPPGPPAGAIGSTGAKGHQIGPVPPKGVEASPFLRLPDPHALGPVQHQNPQSSPQKALPPSPGGSPPYPHHIEHMYTAMLVAQHQAQHHSSKGVRTKAAAHAASLNQHIAGHLDAFKNTHGMDVSALVMSNASAKFQAMRSQDDDGNENPIAHPKGRAPQTLMNKHPLPSPVGTP